jgi:hypothetical protein
VKRVPFSLVRWRVHPRAVKGAGGVGVLPLAFLLAATSCGPRPAAIAEAGSGAAGVDTRVDRERVALFGVSLNTWGKDCGSSSLSAKRLVVRHRTGGGGLLFYHDVKELLVEDAEITVPTDRGGGTKLSRVLEGMECLFASTPSGDPSLPIAVGNGGSGRIVFEGLSIRMVEREGAELLLSAQQGRLSFGPVTLVLDGRIEMRTPLGEELRSPRAAFSGDFEGIHLPTGYEVGGARFGKGALVVGAEGRLAPATGIAEIRLDDRLERTERQILGHLVKRAPRELRPLILALLASLAPADSDQPRP